MIAGRIPSGVIRVYDATGNVIETLEYPGHRLSSSLIVIQMRKYEVRS